MKRPKQETAEEYFAKHNARCTAHPPLAKMRELRLKAQMLLLAFVEKCKNVFDEDSDEWSVSFHLTPYSCYAVIEHGDHAEIVKCHTFVPKTLQQELIAAKTHVDVLRKGAK